MACGAPVIAWPHGSVPEIMEDGAGFVVNDVEEAARAVERLASFDRRRCREVFERRFTAARMAEDYVNVYEQLLERVTAVEFRVAETYLNQGVFAVT
jgi:glycosyltransferase involved in cell wall biosynthesis